ncbi:hypothetical protein ABIE87_006473 [Bradyrhizobium diazoefficiens]|uniref:hypothetical protein n=1 Tax=Bradyrhizobium diazoefficiens TaxID=1355477 RepID=UPI00351876DB
MLNDEQKHGDTDCGQDERCCELQLADVVRNDAVIWHESTQLDENDELAVELGDLRTAKGDHERVRLHRFAVLLHRQAPGIIDGM